MLQKMINRIKRKHIQYNLINIHVKFNNSKTRLQNNLKGEMNYVMCATDVLKRNTYKLKNKKGRSS